MSQIYEFVKKAFQTARYAEGDEQDFVNRLRAGDDYIPALALVMEDAGQMIAHIMLTRMFVRAEKAEHPVLFLAIVSVLFERRNQGIGKQIIEFAFQQARESNHPAVIVVGDPGYYSRFGFEPSVTLGIQNQNNIEDKYVMALELIPGGLHGISGTVSIPT